MWISRAKYNEMKRQNDSFEEYLKYWARELSEAENEIERLQNHIKALEAKTNTAIAE